MKHGPIILATWICIVSLILTVVNLILWDRRKSKKYKMEREEKYKKDKEELRQLLKEREKRRSKRNKNVL